MAGIAGNIKQLLDGRGQTSIAVGQFIGPATLPTSSGPALTKALTEALQEAGVDVKRRAELGISGDYRDVEERTGEVAGLLRARVEDRSGQRINEFQAKITDKAAVAALFGLTVDLEEPLAQDEQILSSIDEPTVDVTDTRIRAAEDNPYGVEVLIKTTADGPYEARAPEDQDGLAFVKIARGEIYSIRLINDSEFDAAATLTIDGLGLFTFSENEEYTHVVIPAGKSLDVLGWHITNQRADEFVVTAYADSAAGSLESTATIGTITAVFAAAWPEDAEPPPGENVTKDVTEDATGRGNPVDTDFQEVRRFIGRPRAAVSVRYTK